MQKKFLGFGLGLRPPHYQDILNTNPQVDWFEIITEDYLVPGGNPLHYLDRIRELYPIVMHGVSLSIGGTDQLDFGYLEKVKQLAARVQAEWVSDHLCWTGTQGINMHDLLPLPYTEEALKHIVPRVKRVQDFLGRQILLENPSSYITFAQSAIPEWEFLAELAKQADCLLLLDINNVYVSSVNHTFDPLTYINAIPTERVFQFHVAGHTNLGTHIIDTHDEDVIDEVWNLYDYALNRFGPVSTLLERDDKIPPLNELVDELNVARQIAQRVIPSIMSQIKNKRLVGETVE